MNLLKKMFIWSCIGICNEVFFTAITEFIDGFNNKTSLVLHQDHQDLHNIKLTGYSYIWLLPIYSLLPILFNLIDLIKTRFSIKILIITLTIMLSECLYGLLLKKIAICPWEDNYSFSQYTLFNVMRLDYFPFWYGVSFFWYTLWLI